MTWAPDEPQGGAAYNSFADVPTSSDGVPMPDVYEVPAEADHEDDEGRRAWASSPMPPMPARPMGPAVPVPVGAHAGVAGSEMTGNLSPSLTLGMSLVIVGLGSAIGAARGGIFTAIAGGLYGGAAVNAYRAAVIAKEDRQEATVSATFAILGAGVATYLVWKQSQEKREARGVTSDE
jgi:hypothetical protein